VITPRKPRFTPRRLSFLALPVALLVIAGLFLGRSAATASPASTSTATSPASAVSTASTSTASTASTKKAKRIARQKKMQKKVITYTNKVRKKAGCAPVKKSKALMKAALAHSKVEAKNQAEGHQFAGEDDLGTRFTKAGYKKWTSIGENAAGGAGGVWFVNAHDVMYGGTFTKGNTTYTSSGWMQDKPHKDNIINCSFKNIGVGAFIDSKGAVWWTQDFGTKK
jgi:uncharacterized protein YkwD